MFYFQRSPLRIIYIRTALRYMYHLWCTDYALNDLVESVYSTTLLHVLSSWRKFRVSRSTWTNSVTSVRFRCYLSIHSQTFSAWITKQAILYLQSRFVIILQKKYIMYAIINLLKLFCLQIYIYKKSMEFEAQNINAIFSNETVSISW